MKNWIALVSAVLATSPAMLTAQETPPAGITYDCDTAANHYSELSLPPGAVPFTVSGKVKLLSIVPGQDYVTMTRLSISNATPQPGPSSEGWAGFQISVPKRSARQSGVALLSTSLRPKGGANATEALARPVVIEKAEDLQELQFTLTYDGEQAIVRLGESQKTLEFAAPQPIVRIVCSTGEFLYTDLVIRPGV
jgi:hypothetical protein